MTLGTLTVLVIVLLVSSVLATGMSLAGLYKVGSHLLRPNPSGDFALEPVAELPPSADPSEPAVGELLALGFQWIGNFRTTAAGQTTWARAFLSADEHTFATLPSDLQTAVLFSVFEDGTCLESSLGPASNRSQSSDGMLQHNAVPDADAEELWHSHVEAICEHRILTGSDVFAWAPEQYREVLHYAHRLLQWRLEGKGPQPPMPAGQVVLASLASCLR